MWLEENDALVEKLMVETFGSDWAKLPETSSNNKGQISIAELDELPDFEADDTPYSKAREVTVYFQPASAGTGLFLDSEEYEMMEFPFDKVPLKTSFGVRVSGRSMEPNFNDGDIVFVRQQPTIEDGETGVFVLNGDAYIKRLSVQTKKTLLLSLNSEYAPMEIRKSDDLRVVGKVIGKLDD